jgi:hypothetical protein
LIIGVGYGLVADYDVPLYSAPRREDQKPRSTVRGAKSVKLRYGPYKVPNMNVNNGLGEFGMMADVPTLNLETYIHCHTRVDTPKSPH